MISISREQFESLVREALSQLPNEVRNHLNNVDVVVDGSASTSQLVGTGIPNEMELLGLYEGIPLTERYGYDMVLPDKITLLVEKANVSEKIMISTQKCTLPENSIIK